MKNKITLVPYGGLANRMRAIASAISLCRQHNRPLEIIWFRHEALNADFSSLFEPITAPCVTLRDASTLDYWMFDRPRRRNFYTPLFFLHLLFSRRLYEEQAAYLYKSHIPFETFSKPGKGYICSCYQMCDNHENINRFRPRQEILRRMDQIRAGRDMSRYIGVHIRRGDNILSINNSPEELFICEMQERLTQGDCQGFYLATDSQQVKQLMKDKFGDKIFFLTDESSRLSLNGMQDAVAEMFLLASTKSIIGSMGSTYSQTAAWIGNIPYMEIRKEQSK